MNTVELIGFYGSDETHALSAWTSTNRELTEDKQKRIPELLKFLAENEHHTPFEKSSLHFLVKCDVASHIHLLKHRIGVSINAESARYKELKGDAFYTPEDWPTEVKERYQQYMQSAYASYHLLCDELTPILGRVRAKESARYVLPYANQITSDVMFNFRSFMHFIELRYSDHAQKEIRAIAKEMLEQVKGVNVFNESLKAFGFFSEV